MAETEGKTRRKSPQDVREHSAKDYYFTAFPEHILIDIDESKVWLHPNDKQTCLCWVDLDDLQEYGFEAEYETAIEKEEVLQESLCQTFSEGPVSIILEMVNIYMIISNDKRYWPPNDEIISSRSFELEYKNDTQWSERRLPEKSHLSNQPWVNKVYRKLPKSERRKIERDRESRYPDYKCDVETSWAVKVPIKCYRYRHQVTKYKFDHYTLKRWGYSLFTVEKNGELNSWYYDSSGSLQHGDAYTSIHLIDDKHIVIRNYGDVSSTIFLELQNHPDEVDDSELDDSDGFQPFCSLLGNKSSGS